MPNDRLRSTMLERGLTHVQLAQALDVDPKTVERWIGGRTPYRRHRYAVAAQLNVDEVYLWPDALSPDQVANASESEIINVYPHRWAVPSDLWRNFFDSAERDIGVLVYSGLFVPEDAGILRIFRKKAAIVSPIPSSAPRSATRWRPASVTPSSCTGRCVRSMASSSARTARSCTTRST